MAITFDYQVSRFPLRKKKKIVDWILLTTYLKQKEVENISYVFCTDEYLLDLNKRFLQHFTYTDIITFDYSTPKKISAEIYISIDRVKENSKHFHNPFDEELHRVMIHGILHCLGYTDKSKRSKALMRKMEDESLRIFEEMS